MPARGTMLTGLTARGNNMRVHGLPLPKDIPTLPGMLAEAGYRTHSVGKLHIQPWQDTKGIDAADLETVEDNPERRVHWQADRITRAPDNYYGFQTQDMVVGHGTYSFIGGDYAMWLKEHAPEEAAKYQGFGTMDVDPAVHYNTWIADRSIDFIDAQSDEQPFFLWCSFPDPHTPFSAVRKYAEMYNAADMPVSPVALDPPESAQSKTLEEANAGRRTNCDLHEATRQIFGMMTHIDDEVARVLDCLERQGMRENTVVIFIADHGEQLGEHDAMHKGVWPYDGSTRIPFIVHVPWADAAPRGRTVDTPVSQIDLVPTVLDLAGVAQPEDPRSTPEHREAFQFPPSLPGESLARVLTEGGEPERGCALVEWNVNNTRKNELLQIRTLVTREYKLAVFAPTGEMLLFDRKKDPLETTNIVHHPAYREIVTDMLVRMVNELGRTEPRIPRQFSGC